MNWQYGEGYIVTPWCDIFYMLYRYLVTAGCRCLLHKGGSFEPILYCLCFHLQLHQGQLRPLLPHAVPGTEICAVQEAGRS